MNELLTLLENFQYSNDIKLVYSGIETWVKDMSIWNLLWLVFILWMTWTVEARATRIQEYNGVEEKKVSNVPKYFISGIVYSLLLTFPHDLFYASSVFLVLIGMMIW